MNKTLITFFTLLFCLTSSVGWSLDYNDLVKRDGVYYKKFSDLPFTGKVNGKITGTFKNGERNGTWIIYHKNGQLFSKGNYKNGIKEGQWITYYDDGMLKLKGVYKNGKEEGYWIINYPNTGIPWLQTLTGNYKDGKKISD
jgi:antitoxin component YwqK of YwqJK toxin-antitoxin module